MQRFRYPLRGLFPHAPSLSSKFYRILQVSFPAPTHPGSVGDGAQATADES